MSKELSKKIKDDWGTVKRFCEKNDINYNTYKQVVYGSGKSSRIVSILKKHKYIKTADDLNNDNKAA